MPRLSRWSIGTIACFAAALLLVGCSSDRGSSEHTQEAGTEGIRRTLDARARTFLLQGEEAFQRGAYQRALTLADSAESYDPDAAVIPFFRGSVYTASNQFDAAEEAYRAAIELDPEYPEARFRMGNIAAQRGRLRDALHLYRVEEDIASSSALYVEMGLTYAKLGAADSARMVYEKAVALDSTNANAHMMYGQFLEETGELEAALAHSRRALSLQPDHPNHRFAVGSQLYQLGRLEEAAEHLQQAADARLLHYPAQYSLGQVFMRLGREEEADHYLARADSARRLMDQIDSAQGAASRNPDAVESWIRLGELFRSAEERNRAVQAFNRAAMLQPRNLAVQNQLGEMMLAEGKTEEAIQRFQAILSVDETLVDAWLNLGLAFATTGDCKAARRSWETVLEHRPGDATAKEYLAGLCQYTAQ